MMQPHAVFTTEAWCTLPCHPALASDALVAMGLEAARLVRHATQLQVEVGAASARARTAEWRLQELRARPQQLHHPPA